MWDLQVGRHLVGEPESSLHSHGALMALSAFYRLVILKLEKTPEFGLPVTTKPNKQ